MLPVYYVCPDIPVPVGGTKVMYDHVTQLAGMGVPAAVVHERAGFRCTWFASDARVIDYASLDFCRPGILVIPETLGINSPIWGVPQPKVIFNQNAFNTFYDFPLTQTNIEWFYNRRDVLGCMVVSESDENLMRALFPSLFVSRVRNCVDGGVFQPTPKHPVIAYMPRKNRLHAVAVVNALRARGRCSHYRFLPLHGLALADVAAALGSSMLFLSFGGPEGFGLPVAEAIACECFVVGYSGVGGRELFRLKTTEEVEYGDVGYFVEAVEKVSRDLDEANDGLADELALSRRSIIDTYSYANQSTDLTVAWKEFFRRTAI